MIHVSIFHYSSQIKSRKQKKKHVTGKKDMKTTLMHFTSLPPIVWKKNSVALSPEKNEFATKP